MKEKDVLKQFTTPIGAPAFVQGPHRFERREYLNITYRTERESLVKLVPEPLEVDEPLVRFEVMKMPDTTGYGAYVECGQAAVVRLGEERGEFLLGMYLDNLPAIAAGRELSAFPKEAGLGQALHRFRHSGRHAGLRNFAGGDRHHGLQAQAPRSG